MLWRVWLLGIIGAAALTAAWLFSTRRLEVSTLFAAALWSWSYVTTDSLELVDATGATRAVDVAAFSYLLLGFALLSFTAFAGVVFGFYPPEQYGIIEQPTSRAETTRGNNSR